MAIHLLDQNTINKIAAGEVIERPMAVVKELIENAIDAGSNMVTVEIKDGGKSLIRITDSGSGIEESDVKLAFTPHATSKIDRVEDLLTVSTLGFRGEALASIASVSQLEMLTKTRTSFNGYRYIIEGGKEKKLETAGCPDGTTFIVRNLFYNTPARLKFLKTAQTEAGYINGVIERMALSHPEISFKFINQNQTRLHTSGNGNLKDVIYSIYGRDIASNLIKLDIQGEQCNITGFIGKPVISRGNRNYINYFINGRYIKSNIIHKAIEEAYSPYSMQHRYPFTVLHFDIEPSYIDVNVHPQKMEIRFVNEKELYKEIYDAISETLKHREFIPEVSFESKKKVNEQKKLTKADCEVYKKADKPELVREKTPLYSEKDKKVSGKKTDNLDVSENLTKKECVPDGTKVMLKRPDEEERKRLYKMSLGIEEKNNEIKKKTEKINPRAKKEADISKSYNKMAVYNVKQQNLFETGIMSEEKEKDIKIIGQVFSTYWILQLEDNMYMVDQHAAHEKVLYEKLVKSFHENDVTVQMVQPPIVLSLSMLEQQALEENMDMLTKAGYNIEPFGGREYMVTGVPAQLPDIASKELLLEVIDGLTQERGNYAPEMLMNKIASMSCKAAVKGGNNLPAEQAYELLKELMKLENPYNCPHGRPTMIKITKKELEKKFKRIV